MFTIKNKVMDGGAWYKKYFWYLYVEFFYRLQLFRKKDISMENVTIENFCIKKWEVNTFALANFIMKIKEESNK